MSDTAVLFGAAAGALLALLLVFLDRSNRKHAEARHRRVIADFEKEKTLRQRQAANRLRYHRAEADKLIPRFQR